MFVSRLITNGGMKIRAPAVHAG